MKTRQRKEIKLENIAKELNTSTVTVSNALNGKKGVGEELRRKILDKAEELGYPFHQAFAQKEERTYCIGVIVTEKYIKKSISIQMEIYKDIVHEARKKDCLTSLLIVDEEADDQKRLVRFLGNLKLDGFVFIGEVDPDIFCMVRQKVKIPVVRIDSCNWSGNEQPDTENEETGDMLLTVCENDKNVLIRTGVDVLLGRMK